MPTGVTMGQFVAALEDLASRGAEPSRVQDYLARTSVAPAELEPYLLFLASHYTRNLVHKTAAFEILVLCCDVGQRAPVHGHEGEHRAA